VTQALPKGLQGSPVALAVHVEQGAVPRESTSAGPLQGTLWHAVHEL